MLPRVLTIGVQILGGLLPVIETAGSGVQCAGQGEPSSVFLCRLLPLPPSFLCCHPRDAKLLEAQHADFRYSLLQLL